MKNNNKPSFVPKKKLEGKFSKPKFHYTHKPKLTLSHGGNKMTNNQNNYLKNKETQRHNIRSEDETIRHNKASEKADQLSAVGSTIGGVGKFMSGIGSFNDPSWYKSAGSLAKFSTQIPLMRPLGSPMYSGNYNLSRLACVCFPYQPTIGYDGVATGPAAPINMAVRSIYQYVREAQFGSTNYDWQDLGLMLIGVSDLFANILYAEKIFCVLSTYDKGNRILPQAFCRASYIDYDDFMNNLAQFRFRINTLIKRAQNLWIPNSFTVFSRRFWLNTFLGKDSNLPNATPFHFRPYSYYRYIETTDEGGALECVRWGDGKTMMKYSEFISVLEDCLQKLLDSEDISIMCGDILKAYTEAKLVKLLPLNDTFASAEFKFVPEVIQQIRNGVSLPTDFYPEQFSIKQNPLTNILYEGPAEGVQPEWHFIDSTGQAVHPELEKVVFDCLESESTSDTMLVSTRFMVMLKSYTGTSTTVTRIDVRGTEILITGKGVLLDIDDKWDEYDLWSIWIGTTLSGSSVIVKDHLLDVAKTTTSILTPRIYYYDLTEQQYPITYLGYTCNTIFMEREVLAGLHTTAIISEFTAPEIGSLTIKGDGKTD